MKKLSNTQTEILIKCFGLVTIAVSAMYLIEYILFVK